jgi:hypothetical protein
MLSFLRRGPRTTAPDSLVCHLSFRIAPDVKVSIHDGGAVLMNIRRGTVFSANRVGAMIWNAAAERGSLDRPSLARVVESISNEFRIPPQTAQEDATEFLAQLAAAGLLVSEAN